MGAVSGVSSGQHHPDRHEAADCGHGWPSLCRHGILAHFPCWRRPDLDHIPVFPINARSNGPPTRPARLSLGVENAHYDCQRDSPIRATLFFGKKIQKRSPIAEDSPAAMCLIDILGYHPSGKQATGNWPQCTVDRLGIRTKLLMNKAPCGGKCADNAGRRGLEHCFTGNGQ